MQYADTKTLREHINRVNKAIYKINLTGKVDTVACKVCGEIEVLDLKFTLKQRKERIRNFEVKHLKECAKITVKRK